MFQLLAKMRSFSAFYHIMRRVVPQIEAAIAFMAMILLLT